MSMEHKRARFMLCPYCSMSQPPCTAPSWQFSKATPMVTPAPRVQRMVTFVSPPVEAMTRVTTESSCSYCGMPLNPFFSSDEQRRFTLARSSSVSFTMGPFPMNNKSLFSMNASQTSSALPCDANRIKVDEAREMQLERRPGYIYRCSVCSRQFSNAQAFGGHMSSHSKNKRSRTQKGESSGIKKAEYDPETPPVREKRMLFDLNLLPESYDSESENIEEEAGKDEPSSKGGQE